MSSCGHEARSVLQAARASLDNHAKQGWWGRCKGRLALSGNNSPTLAACLSDQDYDWPVSGLSYSKKPSPSSDVRKDVREVRKDQASSWHGSTPLPWSTWNIPIRCFFSSVLQSNAVYLFLYICYTKRPPIAVIAINWTLRIRRLCARIVGLYVYALSVYLSM